MDGKKTRVIRNGNLHITDTQSSVSYNEENAMVSVTVQDKQVTLERKGDYSLFLPLQKGKTLDGTLGLGDNAGAIQVHTQRIGYSILDKKLMLNLKYTLIIGEPQEMQVKIEALGE